MHNLSLSGKHDWTEWEWGCHGNVMNLNEQRERQETSSYFYSMGAGNEQGNMILIWRTNRGACDRRQLEDTNSFLFDHQAQDKPVQAVRRNKNYTLI